jgi:NADH:ubiquinone oxidoreductase subunit 5 (subunit L)/multisubunit Na+/H+ antiporter MnhA subunit
MHKKARIVILIILTVLVNSWILLGNMLSYKFEVDEVWHANAAKALERQTELDTYILLNYAVYLISALVFTWLLLTRDKKYQTATPA